MRHLLRHLATAVLAAAVLSGCSDDEGTSKPDSAITRDAVSADAGADQGASDQGVTADQGVSDRGVSDQGVSDQGATDDAAGGRTTISLPGSRFFPEGVALADDGTVFVGSLASGQIVRAAPGETSASAFISDGRVASAVGMTLSPDGKTIWVCGSDVTGATNPALYGFDSTSGAATNVHALGGAGFCNDLAFDANGNLYATDSLGSRIVRVRVGDLGTDHSAANWIVDSTFDVGPGQFGLNGIAVVGTTLYAVGYQQGQLYRIPIEANGDAGTISTIQLDRRLTGPDGLKAIDASALLVVENLADQLSRIDLTGGAGTVTVLARDLDVPTTVAPISDEAAWVVEGQLDDFNGPGQPTLPFKVVTVSLK